MSSAADIRRRTTAARTSLPETEGWRTLPTKRPCSDTRASANAGLHLSDCARPPIRQGAHLGAVDGGRRSAALLSCDNACRRLQDACKQRRMLFDECDRPRAGTGASAWPRRQSRERATPSARSSRGKVPATASRRSGRQPPLLQPWHCESAGRAGGRTEAVAPRPGRARLDGALATARSTVLAAVDVGSDDYARPGRRGSAAHFPFRLGRRAAVVARDRADNALGCWSRTIEAPAAQPTLAGRAGFRSGAERQLDVGRSAVPHLLRSTSPAPAARRTRVAGGAEEPLLARRIRSRTRRRQDAYAAPRRRRTRARSRRLSLRLRERLCSPARTPRCRSSSAEGARFRAPVASACGGEAGVVVACVLGGPAELPMGSLASWPGRRRSCRRAAVVGPRWRCAVGGAGVALTRAAGVG
jgi:hypothetical protein